MEQGASTISTTVYSTCFRWYVPIFILNAFDGRWTLLGISPQSWLLIAMPYYYGLGFQQFTLFYLTLYLSQGLFVSIIAYRQRSTGFADVCC